MSEAAQVEALVARLSRDEGPTLVAALARRTRDVELAEDCVQEAWLSALRRWPEDGVPAHPTRWLMTAAWRRALDRYRKLGREEVLEASIAQGAAPEPDERVRFLFACCHPSIDPRQGVALALRTLCGLRTEEVARAFLRTPEAMARQMRRAAEKIRVSRIRFAVPDESERPERLGVVLAAIYLVFNEGYAPTRRADGRDLAADAIFLGKEVAALLPNEPEARALVALMLLHHARRDTRFDARGVPIALDAQDRTRWRRDEVASGVTMLQSALSLRAPGPYQVQAAIAALHAQAERPDQTDWPQISALYGVLLQHQPTAVVELNAAVAFAMSAGLERGLEWLDSLVQRRALPGYHLLPAARADLLSRLGRTDEAAAAYEEALAHVRNEGERTFLLERRAALGARKRRRRRRRTREEASALSDEAWRRVAFLCERKSGPGRPPKDARLMLDGVLWVLTTGRPWRELPKDFGPWQTVYHRFRKWENDGTLVEIATRLAGRSRAGRKLRKSS